MRWLGFFKFSVFFAFSTLVGIGTVSARELRTWASHGWNVGAYSNDRTGEFSHCAAGASYRSGIYLVFSVGRFFSWSMGFANPQWKLTPGAKYPIRYTIDDRIPATTEASAISENMVEITLPPNTGMFELFRKGRLLRVEGSGQNFFFQLDNTSAVLKEVLDCATAYASSPVTTSDGRNPFVPQQSTRPSVSSSDRNLAGFRAEATAVIANVLASSGLSGFKVVEDLKPDAAAHAIWTAPGLLGALKILEAENPENSSTIIMAMDAQGCKNNFLSGRLPTSEPNVVRAKTACSSGSSDSILIEYTIVRRPRGGSYVFSVIGSENAPKEAVDRANSSIHDAAIRSIK